MKERKYKRVQTVLSGVSKTDQSAKRTADINVLVKRFKKQGGIPVNTKDLQYGDVTNVKSLSQLLEVSNLAQEAFQSLPLEVRKACGFKASNLEDYIKDEKNYDDCVKYGIIVEEEKEPVFQVQVQNASDLVAGLNDGGDAV